jgi:hypothetical protein
LPTANPFYRGFLIAVPAFLLAVEFCLVGMGLVRKTPGSISRTFPLVQLKFDTRLGGSDLVYF